MIRSSLRDSRAFLLPLLLVIPAALAGCGSEPGGDGDTGMVGVLRSAERTKAQTQMRVFDTCLKRYLLEQGHLPDTLEELAEPAPGGGLPCLVRIPLDPWGNAYDYRPLEDPEYQIVSWGPDGTARTVDDILGP